MGNGLLTVIKLIVQISMNVPLIPATPMLCALILMALMYAPAMLDSPEMDLHVKVILAIK